jgi:nitrite reductase/ring-hydroxylating ferredoxin subunit
VTLVKRWFEVATTRDIDDEESLPVEVNGEKIALFNLGGKFYAISDHCSLDDVLLSDGYIEDGVVYCGDDDDVCFEIRTGNPCNNNAADPVRRYPVKTEAGVVYIGFTIEF